MHMARRAAAWAAWTCNTGFTGYSQRERASARSFLCARPRCQLQLTSALPPDNHCTTSRPHRTFDVKAPVFGAALRHRVTAKTSPFDREGHNDVGSMSSDRAIRHLGRRTRRQNPCTVRPERKGEHAIEVHFVEARRRDMTQDGCVDLALAARSPAIERGLHLMGVPGHNKVRDERERTRLGTQLGAPPPTQPGVVNTVNTPV